MHNQALNFYHIYPYCQAPVLAKKYTPAVPKRARQYCMPVNAACREGMLFFPPLTMQAKLTSQSLLLRYQTEDGEQKQHEIALHAQNEIDTETSTNTRCSNNNYIIIHDLSPSRSDELQKKYRARMQDESMPDYIDKDNFGFYEVLANAMIEPEGAYLQLWLGGVIQTAPGTSVMIKHPSNFISDPGWHCLDAIVESDHWHGWFAVVIQIPNNNEWVTIDENKPLCQAIPLTQGSTSLELSALDEIPQEHFTGPLKWHVFDPEYGVKPGKYQRERQKRK
ncbi:MAG: hypothetical protein COA42_21240 [Alteromonadaceae bacterium]|nr:MAG: hypothetical protein COA42_21240 [Alteromonadaceae bacterium]